MTRLRWFLWHWLVKVPVVCNSNAHSLLIWRYRRSPLIGPMCREDYARNRSVGTSAETAVVEYLR